MRQQATLIDPPYNVNFDRKNRLELNALQELIAELLRKLVKNFSSTNLL
jgi:hypothetical protein